MAGEENNTPHQEPTPLALEGGATQQIDLDVRPKAADKKTPISYDGPRRIKSIIRTPKESGSSDTPGATPHQNTSDNTSGDSSSDAQRIADARARMNSEPAEPVSLSSSSDGSSLDTEAPDEDDCKLYAEMIVEGIDWLAVWGFQYYAKDPEEEAYKPDEKRKKKLMQLLAKMLMRVGKKHPVALYFFATLILMYVPSFRKAHAHKQKVEAEKAAQALLNEEAAAKKEAESGGSGGKKRRSLKQDSEISDATLED